MRLALVATLSAMLATGVAAHADSITFVLNNPNQTATTAKYNPTLYFNAAISAPVTNKGDFYLNGEYGSVNGLFVSEGETELSDNLPAFLTPGESVTGTIFAAVASGVPTGVYNGTVDIFGGANANALDEAAIAKLTITVAPPTVTAVTPEPSSILLLGTGLLGVAGAIRRR